MFEGTGLVKGKILYEKEYEHLQVEVELSTSAIAVFSTDIYLPATAVDGLTMRSASTHSNYVH